MNKVFFFAIFFASALNINAQIEKYIHNISAPDKTIDLAKLYELLP
jgi:hypothetical protein